MVPLSGLRLVIYVFFVSLARDSSILLLYSKNLFLVLLIFLIVFNFIDFFFFLAPPFFMTIFHLLALGLFCSFSSFFLWKVIETFFFFLIKVIWMWITLSTSIATFHTFWYFHWVQNILLPLDFPLEPWIIEKSVGFQVFVDFPVTVINS